MDVVILFVSLKKQTNNIMKNLKKRLLGGELIELHNESDFIVLWFQERTNNFCLQFNCKVIKATKTWKPIKDKLESIGNLNEVV